MEAIELISKEEKMIRLLQYLKRYTDKNNPASLPLIDYYFEEKYKIKNFLGHKTTRRNLIKNLVTILNSDANGNLFPEEEWKLVYDDFVRDIAKEWAELIIEDYGSEEPYSIGEDEILVTY